MRVKLTTLHLLTIFTLLCPFFSYGQYYNFQTYSLAEGLPQSQVFSILQDRRGGLWAGTNGGGAARFNGKSFEIFSKKDGMVNSQVRQIIEDSKGNIWFATVFGLSKYDGKAFKNFKVDDGFVTSAQQNILEDKQGRIWNIAQGRAYTIKYYDGGDTLVNFTSKYPKILNPQNQFFYPFVGRDSVASFVTNQGTYRVEGDELVRDSLSQEIFRNRVNFPFYDNNRNFWVATSAELSTAATRQISKLYIQKKGSTDFKLLPFPEQFAAGLANVIEDQKGNIWVLSFGAGLGRYDGKEVKIFNTTNGLPHNFFTVMFEDNEGNLWLGSNQGGGLVKFSGERFSYFTDANGLPNKSILSFLEDSKNNIWLGQNNNLSYFDGEKLNNVLLNQAYGNISKIIETKNNEILLATQNSGLMKYKDGQVVSAAEEYKINSGFLLDIYQEKDTIWFSALGQGVIKYHNGDTTNINIPAMLGLGIRQVNHIMRAKDGTFWFSTAAGLVKYKNDDEVEVYNEKNNGLTSNLLLESVEDKVGNIWTVTYGGGLFKFNGKTFEIFTSDDGLAADLVYSIIKDNDGNLWVGSQNGIDKITLNEIGNIKRIKNYNKNQGFIGIENNRKASMVDSKGNIWFGTIGGAVKYNPKEDIKSVTAPATKITNVKLHFKNIDWQSESYKEFVSGVNGWSNVPQNLKLPHHENHLTFNFEALNYRSPEGIKYQWILEGLENEWSPSSSKNEAVYSSLPHGNYTFKVRAINAEGVISETAAELQFKITPAFWQTILFKFLIAGFILSATFTGVRIRIKNIEDRKKELEQQVKLKTAEVVKQKDEIQEQNAELEQQQDEILAQNEYIIEQNSELQKKNNDITSSINYAKRIQHAMLPSLEKVQKELPDSFVLFKPRDIVSGDFYWFQEHMNKLIIAAVDCTGHGVPGAFMSMIGNSILGQIVNEKDITDADQILTHLDLGIREALKQHETENRDGMDIALTVIDKQEKTIEFAGAKNPLYYIQNNEFNVIKGDKHSIGGGNRNHNNVFTKHKINLNQLVTSGNQLGSDEHDSSTTFYLFSDGYQDQFGGKQDRKFMSKRFKELLFNIYKKPMHEQKQILDDTIENWMTSYNSDNKQVDDILVIGVKV